MQAEPPSLQELRTAAAPPHGRAGVGRPAAARAAVASASARPVAAALPPAGRARDAATRHSRRVRLLRIWLPLVGVALVLVVLGWIAWSSLTGRFGLANVLFTKDGVTMVEPHISGRAQGRSYDMVAKRGIQSFDNAKKVRFEEVTGRVEMQDRRWVRVQAPIGIFDGTAQTLRLEGGVDVVTSEGYHITTRSADIDLEHGDMRTAERVTINTGDQVLSADAARVGEGGRHLVFTGGVRLDLVPKARTVQPDDDTAAAPPDTPRQETVRKDTP